MDVFAYSAPMRRGEDLEVMKAVSDAKQSDELLLILTTNGGDPDAAYKIGRYLQHRYESFKILIPGLCKSAGTLLAIAAEELVFSPYGELGPLDIQLSKTDDIAGMESGLNISEALSSLEQRVNESFHELVMEVIASSGGVISFPTASHSAAEIVTGIYGPVFAKIDPEEVGSRTRAMRIGEDYGKRLNMQYGNLKSDMLPLLSRSYSSHGFVIDMKEATVLFNNVREASNIEKELVDMLGNTGRMSSNSSYFKNLSAEYAKLREKGSNDGPENRGGEDPHSDTSDSSRPNGKDPDVSSEAPSSKAGESSAKAE